ncbi:MAG: NAD(P)-dependent alcohol dehydrogenase [Anaerolineae bacterium]|nr:NAD(P)-dependent alcohol dehydrogenase [Anaerolineae bacterium]
MKAIVYTKYGSPDVLELKEVAKPTPKDDQVLVKVRATSVNLSDWEFLTGRPLYARVTGLRRPGSQILGSDIAGQVAAVGKNVTKFQPGDAVFGDILQYMGGFAEYVCAPEHRLAQKPDGLTFAQAAAIPQAGVIALQGIRDKGQIQAGQKVLINGAGGGAGSFAVQLAKMVGAAVTAVDNTAKLEFMRTLGADHVIDYTQEDFTKNGAQYDFILDVIAYRSAFAYKRSLSSQGRYYMVGGSMSTLFSVLIWGALLGMRGHKKIAILPVQPNTKDLLALTELVAAGKIAPMIDRCYALEDTAVALRYLGEGQSKGKVVITVADD